MKKEDSIHRSLTIRISEENLRKLEAISEKLDRSKSWIIRRLIHLADIQKLSTLQGGND